MYLKRVRLKGKDKGREDRKASDTSMGGEGAWVRHEDEYERVQEASFEDVAKARVKPLSQRQG
eukprot:782385-Pleurochrysis_carterae.AAC.1